MTYLDSSADTLEHKIKTAKKIQQRILESRKGKKRALLRLFLWFPYFTIAHISIQLISWIIPKLGQSLAEKYIRHYFKRYFKYKGVDHYEVDPLPTTFERPSIIFTTRPHDVTALFANSLFSFRLLMPLTPPFKFLRTHPFIPWHGLGKQCQRFAYPDQDLDVAFPNIQTLLEAGYSLFVYVNQGYSNDHYSNTLLIHQKLFTLLNGPYNCYFLRLREWEDYPLASPSKPIMVSANCVDQNTLFENTAPEEPFRLERIANFFQFRYAKITSS